MSDLRFVDPVQPMPLILCTVSFDYFIVFIINIISFKDNILIFTRRGDILATASQEFPTRLIIVNSCVHYSNLIGSLH